MKWMQTNEQAKTTTDNDGNTFLLPSINFIDCGNTIRKSALVEREGLKLILIWDEPQEYLRGSNE